MTNGTARAGGPFPNRKMTSLRFGLREIEEGEVAGRHRQRSTRLQLDRMAITALVARVSQFCFTARDFYLPYFTRCCHPQRTSTEDSSTLSRLRMASY